MRRITENKIEKKVVDEVYRHLGITGSKLIIQGDDGFPDRIFWIPGGKPLLIEFKKPGEPARPKQIEAHKRLASWGYTIRVVDNVIDGLSAVVQAVEASEPSEDGYRILNHAKRRWFNLSPRPRENINHTRRDKAAQV